MVGDCQGLRSHGERGDAANADRGSGGMAGSLGRGKRAFGAKPKLMSQSRQRVLGWLLMHLHEAL